MDSNIHDGLVFPGGYTSASGEAAGGDWEEMLAMEKTLLKPATKTLSSAALEALQEFYAERDKTAEKFHRLKTQAEEEDQARAGMVDEDEQVGHGENGMKGKGEMNGTATNGTTSGKGTETWSMDLFAEDWNISQFWYSEETATSYARQLLAGTTSSSTIVVVSAPSVFIQLKNLVSAEEAAGSPKPRLVLLEHDARFEVFGKEFLWYDFNSPMKVPADLKGRADRIIIDPPFLSEECQTKSALTVRLLARKPQKNHHQKNGQKWQEDEEQTKIIVCTGERMESLVTQKLYKPLGVRTTSWDVAHARGLSNEFRCYANFECEEWSWMDA